MTVWRYKEMYRIFKRGRPGIPGEQPEDAGKPETCGDGIEGRPPGSAAMRYGMPIYEFRAA